MTAGGFWELSAGVDLDAEFDSEDGTSYGRGELATASSAFAAFPGFTATVGEGLVTQGAGVSIDRDIIQHENS